ncbi:hypothetical protein HNR40_008587 [Nonomuraea endophytica]|uniref:Uncharacterized protein n=1 Tax=Nonomuraea endophytica TaxID=714136 RepID=A0A7W8ABC1_9ACTN|nr:hypothetical protein [Nonomuraea endophytica]
MPWAMAGGLAAGIAAAAGLRALIIRWRRAPIEPPA